MLAVALAAASVGLLAAGQEVATPSWLARYETGVRDAEHERWAAARRNLQLALSLRPEGALNVSLSGSQSVDYLPHLYLAIVHHMLGEADPARIHCDPGSRESPAAPSSTGLVPPASGMVSIVAADPTTSMPLVVPV